MSYALNNGLSLSLFLNNIEYNLSYNNVLNFLHMSSSVTQVLPTIHFSLTDTNSDIIKTGIPDGIQIKVVIKSGQANSKTYNFRKFHSNKQLSNGIYTYDVDGYFTPSKDSVKYWIGTSCEGLQGTSNSVLQQIANICGLQYSGLTTNDSQNWFQQNKTYGSFAKFIRQHGYVNNNSCMSLGLDLNGTLIYNNLNAKQIKPPIQIVAYKRSETAITAVDYSVVQQSGFNNATTGYSMGLISQSVVPPALVTEESITPVDPVAVESSVTSINTNNATLTTNYNSLTTNLNNLTNNLSGADTPTQQAVLTTVLNNNTSVLNTANLLNTNVITASNLNLASNNKASAIIANSQLAFSTNNANLQLNTIAISNAQILVNRVSTIDPTTLPAAMLAVTNVSNLNLNLLTTLNANSVLATVTGSLTSTITTIINNSNLASVYTMGSATITDVLNAADSANVLVGNAVSLAASASSSAAAAGVASASSGFTTSSMSSSSTNITQLITSSLNSAVSGVEKLIQDQVLALSKKAAFELPTFGPTSQGATSTPINSIVFVSDVKAPLLNTEVKAIAKRGAYSYSAVDSGNTHETYDQAEYQNIRYSNLFSLKLEILLDTQSNIPLLSQINFSVTDIDNNQSVAYAGLYQIISKAIYVQGVNYAEKLEVARHGTNDTYTNG